MIHKTHALALQIQPFSNTSHLVTWLLADGTRTLTLLKGACRPKNAFLGQYDLFCTSELLYYARQPAGVRIARECTLLEPRLGLRRHWRAYACASYVAELLRLTSLEGGIHPELYVLAETALNALDRQGGRAETLFWFEMQWLEISGFRPQLRQCTRCNRVCDPPLTGLSWGLDGLICGACARAEEARGRGHWHPLAPDILAILRRWQGPTDTRAQDTIQCTPRQVLVITRILGRFIGHHLEETLECREMVLGLVRTNAAKKERSS